MNTTPAQTQGVPVTSKSHSLRKYNLIKTSYKGNPNLHHRPFCFILPNRMNIQPKTSNITRMGGKCPLASNMLQYYWPDKLKCYTTSNRKTAHLLRCFLLLCLYDVYFCGNFISVSSYRFMKKKKKVSLTCKLLLSLF